MLPNQNCQLYSLQQKGMNWMIITTGQGQRKNNLIDLDKTVDTFDEVASIHMVWKLLQSHQELWHKQTPASENTEREDESYIDLATYFIRYLRISMQICVEFEMRHKL